MMTNDDFDLFFTGVRNSAIYFESDSSLQLFDINFREKWLNYLKKGI